MKTLLLMRHAKSSWSNESLADHDRPLNQRGKRDAPRMGQLLVEEDLVPDLIICSTAKRARKTCMLVTAGCGFEGETLFTNDLYEADPLAYLQQLQALPEAHPRVLMIGHNPTLEELVLHLTDDMVTMPTATVVQLELPISAWHQLTPLLRGELVRIWMPRELSDTH